MGALDWVEFPEGRARFAGGTRGAGTDDKPHETFAVEINGVEYFGEIRDSWIDDYHFNVEIVAFGWGTKDWIGMSMPGLCARFTEGEIETAQHLILDLIKAVPSFEERPFVMGEGEEFTGKVIFRDRWALLKSGASDEGMSS